MHQREFDFGFAIKWMVKDLGYCLDQAEGNNTKLAFTQEIYDRYTNLMDKGHTYSDTSALMMFDELNKQVTNQVMIKASLTEKQLIDFNNDGFLTVDNFIELQYLEDLKTRINLLFKGSFETGIEPDEWNWRQERDPSDVTRQICNAWKSDSLIKRLVCSSIIGESVSKLMGWKGARLVQDNVLWKPPQGKALNFHQDAAYDDWIIPQTMVTCCCLLYTSPSPRDS